MRVSVDGLSKSFGNRMLFEDLGQEFFPNEVNVILGESGSGKTTLLNIIGLFEPADSGIVSYDGSQVSGLSKSRTRKLIRSHVAYIYQDIRIFEDLTVRENLKLALRFSSVPKSNHESIIDSILTRVGLDGFQPRISKELSGGEKQRVAIARALLSGKPLLLAAEPTGALDEENSRSVIRLIRDINERERCTILMVTHSMLVASEFEHRFWLRSGRLHYGSDEQ